MRNFFHYEDLTLALVFLLPQKKFTLKFSAASVEEDFSIIVMAERYVKHIEIMILSGHFFILYCQKIPINMLL